VADKTNPIEQPEGGPNGQEKKRVMEKAQEDAADERETERGYQ
jgi:hypothetical protein